MDVAVIPVDERFLALEPRKDYLPSARRLSGLNAKTPRRRLERIDDVGKAGRWRLRGGAVRPSTQPCEREGDDHLHRETSSFSTLRGPTYHLFPRLRTRQVLFVGDNPSESVSASHVAFLNPCRVFNGSSVALWSLVSAMTHGGIGRTGQMKGRKVVSRGREAPRKLR